MTSEEIHILFEKAFDDAYKIPQDTVPQDVQLVLYGLYKQSTSGSSTYSYNQNPQDLRNAFKLNAWMQVQELSEDDAKLEYIKIINELKKERNIK